MTSGYAAGLAAERVCIFAQHARTGLGDLVMRNGLFTLVRRAFPNARSTLVVGSNDAEDFDEFLSRHCPVDDVMACPPCDAGPPTEGDGAWDKFRAELRGRDFDACVVDAGTLALHAGIAAEAGIPVRVGVLRGHPEEELLTAAAPIVARGGGLADLADYLDAYAAALGVPPTPLDAVVPPFPFEREGPPLDLPHPRFALHLGGGTYWNRRWPLPSYVELCERLLTTVGGSIVLIGTDEHVEHTQLLAAVDHRVRDRIHELGEVSLARTATVVTDCDLFFGSDSGPMHIAVALGAETVTLYGPADGVLFWEHVYPGHHPVGRRWPCHVMPHDWPTRDRAPCEHGCRYQVRLDQPEYPRCVADLTVDEVYDAITAVLRRQPVAQ